MLFQDKYHICLVVPDGYIHSMVFKELAMLLIYSFASLGISCTFKANCLDPNRINIILGYHLIGSAESLKNYRYIPYQLEQLGAKDGWYNENLKNILQNAYEVWDYSELNIKFLKEKGITAKHLPIGYHEKLETIKHAEKKDIDILFYGCINDRRKKILDELSSAGLKVEILFNTYGEKRDAYIARAKIVLNMHYYDSQIFEAVRVSYLLNNKVFVVSEQAMDSPYRQSGLVVVPYSQIVSKCKRSIFIHQQIANKTYDLYKFNFLMNRFIDEVLRKE